jgi:hypothetical protein
MALIDGVPAAVPLLQDHPVPQPVQRYSNIHRPANAKKAHPVRFDLNEGGLFVLLPELGWAHINLFIAAGASASQGYAGEPVNIP